VKQKVAGLIGALDEVDVAPHDGGLGWEGIDFRSDRCVRELIEIGDQAIPALIETIDRDNRPTRTGWPEGRAVRKRRVIPVALFALEAVRAILSADAVETPSGRVVLWFETAEQRREIVKGLRAYWRKYGALPLEKRMMTLLSDPGVSPWTWREAALTLSQPGIGSPAVAGFREPTVAEAIVAALERDTACSDYDLERTYLRALVYLGDRRIGPKLASPFRLAAGKHVRQRLLADVARQLGEPGPMRAFASDFAAGRVKLPPDSSRKRGVLDSSESRDEFGLILRMFADSALPETEGALNSLLGARHPLHARAVADTLHCWIWYPGVRESFFLHPSCLALLRSALEDERDSGAVYKIYEGEVMITQGGVAWQERLPESLQDPKNRIVEVPERHCDRAALALQTLALGMPSYHPLHKDARHQLARVRWAVRQYPVAYRVLTPEERDWLECGSDHPRFVPAVSLERAATEADVKAGRALFHLDGQGRKATLELPAAGLLVRSEGEPTKVLILQAEVGPGGTVYGVVGEGVIGRFPGHRVVGVRALKDLGVR
jgi:hypothetical protein